PLDALRRQLEVNVVGQVAVTQALLPHLRKARGRIVNIGSVSGLISSPFSGAYAASKFALEALTDSLRMELRPWRIHVSIVEPGNIQTPIWAKSLAAAEALQTQLPAEAERLYGPHLRAARTATQKSAAEAAPPDVVVKAVAHALLSRWPRTRYMVGRHAGLEVRIGRWLPDRWRDALIARYMGLR
ncbi:MAG: SDR family NAD(P)-dependent oxidoreductase, partial [Acidobacteriia bacterium]|nr:SDR family NAD(P)-dependent oxidoreductase [Terriglobia bacterium]